MIKINQQRMCISKDAGLNLPTLRDFKKFNLRFLRIHKLANSVRRTGAFRIVLQSVVPCQFCSKKLMENLKKINIQLEKK